MSIFLKKKKTTKNPLSRATVGFPLMSKLKSFTFCFLGMGWVQEHLSCAGEDLNHCEHSLLSPGFIFFLCFILLVPAFFFKVFYSDLAKERLF